MHIEYFILSLFWYYDAKVLRIIRVPKKKTDNYKNRPLAYTKGRNKILINMPIPPSDNGWHMH